MSLDYEGEYKDDEADIEAGFPVDRKLPAPGIDVRELKGGKAVTVTHRGPHETVGRSYALVFEHIRSWCLRGRPARRCLRAGHRSGVGA